MKIHSLLSNRRKVLGGSAAAAVALVIASVAWACTTVDGFTWYSDDTWSKSGSSGTQVTVKATEAKTSTSYYMISGVLDEHEHPCLDNWVKENPSSVTSSSTGAIANTSGTIDRSTGQWEVCFATTDIDNGHPNSVTSPVYFQVV